MQIKEVMPGMLVSADGRVFLEAKYHDRGNTKRKYKHVCYGGEKHDVHRLVASAFVPNPDNKPCVCHTDDDPQNNSVDNLWWGTHTENMQDARDKGKFAWKAIDKYIVIYDKHGQGLSNREIARQHNVCESRISQILKYFK